jgi:formyltetrahydrofolate deformylase
MSSATLILSCEDRKGLVAKISQFLFQRDANIIDLDEHVDKNEKMFFIRIEWELNGQANLTDDFMNEFKKLTDEINANWDIKLSEDKKRLAVFVSKYDHCLLEILWRYRNKELHADIPLIISNHPDLEPLAKQYDIPYYCFPITKENKREQEKKELELLREHNIDTIILARYMQILTPDFISEYPNNIINIHHSFLPAFIGADPYKKGV